MSSSVVPFLPETAPFSPAQRAWLNGFLAGLLSANHARPTAPAPSPSPATVAAEPVEDFPWHDSAMKIDERLKLAEGRPPQHVLMAAMAQLDCGACGYLCKTYAEAIASGAEKDLNKCSPGGKETSAKLRELVKLTVNQTTITAPAPVVAPAPSKGHSRDEPFPAPLLVSRRLNGDQSEKDVRHIE